MRCLTIKRQKSVVACFNKMKIYIEDPTSSDLVINNVPCRFLGGIKNNEEVTFEIGENEAKVFVIADQLSKSFCNDFYQLPEGGEDVVLSGKNRFNLASGNAFLFDNNGNEEALQNRKKSSRKGIWVLVIAAIIGFAIGILSNVHLFIGGNTEPKAFSDNGMTIVLTNEFWEADFENYTNCYDSKRVAVLSIKEEFSMFEGFEDYSVEEYGLLSIEYNELDSTLNEENGLTWFEYDYTNPDSNITYRYYSYVYKSNDAFWLVQFATSTEYANEYRDRITEWAKSISFE